VSTSYYLIPQHDRLDYLLESLGNNELTRLVNCPHSIETFLDQEYCKYNIDQERGEIINILREKAGVIASQEYTVNIRKKLFTVKSWN